MNLNLEKVIILLQAMDNDRLRGNSFINVRIKRETAASVISHNTSLHQLIPNSY